ncbi:MAG TPA: DUF4202 domain-containing protein [Ilumatobacteraceae bacterium]|nr:DUF4202 domain-containing protein [Ilumatobacteraceae bacterium]
MCGLTRVLYDAAVEAIDTANTADPTRVVVRGAEQPLALAHGRIAAEWVVLLSPGVDDAVRLAARAHHLCRWELPRSDYAAGRAGYLQWKRDQRRRHADDLASIMRTVGYDEPTVTAAQAAVLRQGDGGQLVEDAACLVFIETQLAAVAGQLDRDHLVEVIRKTAKKMSGSALAAVSTIPLGEVEHGLLAEALGTG